MNQRVSLTHNALKIKQIIMNTNQFFIAMKKTKFYLGIGAMLLAGFFAACSDNEIKSNEPDAPTVDDGSKVYMAIDISGQTPNGSRSATKPEGGTGETEVGQDPENKISNIMVVLVGLGQDGETDNCFIARWTKTFEAGKEVDIKGNGQTIMASFNRSALTDHYDAHKDIDDASKIAVYVICNYNDYISNNITNGSLNWKDLIMYTRANKDATTSYTNNDMPYWKGNNFLMSNAIRYTSTIPLKSDIEGNKYNSASNPYSLTSNGGPIPVERAVARFDYAPYLSETESPDIKNDNDGKGYYYIIAEEQAADPQNGVKAQPEIRAYLTRMSLVNMSRQFYLFRRTSADGTNNNWVIGGTEVNTNYVVDPEYSFKKTTTSTTPDASFTNLFHYWVNDIKLDQNQGNILNNSWFSANIADVTIAANDNKDGYYRWRYVIPNTIPGDINNQKNGISTGIVFKARIEAKDDSYGVGAQMKEGYDIFSFQGKLIGSWADVAELAKSEHTSNADLKIAYNNAIEACPSLKVEEGSNPETWKNLSEKLNDQRDAATAAGFARFRYGNGGYNGVTDNGYFCNYNYWNRHNDNGKNNEMGIMEFGVVRNNVYKLAVTSIKRLGHPIDPKNDPDPVDPEDPDEKAELYMTVSVRVLPWTVRKNNITFD